MPASRKPSKDGESVPLCPVRNTDQLSVCRLSPAPTKDPVRHRSVAKEDDGNRGNRCAVFELSDEKCRGCIREVLKALPVEVLVESDGSGALEKGFRECNTDKLLDVPVADLENPGRSIDWRVRRLLEWLECRGGQIADHDLSLRVFSREMRVSAQHLGRLFQKAIGLTFHEYLRIKKMQRALELLQDASITVKEVSGVLGYTDCSNFRRDFRKFCGLGPREYQRQRARQMKRCPFLTTNILL